MRDLSVLGCIEYLRDWLCQFDLDHQAVQLVGALDLVRRVLRTANAVAKSRGFLAGSINLNEVQRIHKPQPGVLALDRPFVEFVERGSDNSKLIRKAGDDGLRPTIRTFLIVDALGYAGEHRLEDIKLRLLALNNGRVPMWLLFASVHNAPGDRVASNPTTGLIQVIE